MKIKKISFRSYKKFIKPTSFSFTDSDGSINDKTLIIGENGSGKTSILHAIVALIATATRDNFNPDSLDWPGFDYRLIQSGKLPLQIEAEIEFSKLESSTTKEYARRLIELGVSLGTPSERNSIKISLDNVNKKVQAEGGASAYYQFSGYQYAKRLAALSPNKSALFENVGNIYWYSEQRNSYNLSNLLDNELPQIDFIRSFLSSAYSYHVAVKSGEREIKEGEFDFYEKLEHLYCTVFPGRSFEGSAPRFDIYEQSKAPDFFLNDGSNQYELGSMSAGERAIFPILMDFARWNINNSIIIIDELELHLHPSLQQAFVRVLSGLGKNNQFILTSHSDNILSMFDESQNQVIRL